MYKKIVIYLALLISYTSAVSQTHTVIVQPGKKESMDATVKSAAPTTAFPGSEFITASRSTAGNYERSLIKFDLKSIRPGVDIISAHLILFGVNHSGSGKAALRLMPDKWDQDEVNWDLSGLLRNKSIDAGLPTILLDAATEYNQSYNLDVTDMVQKMVNTPLLNFGWMLHVLDESTVDDMQFVFGSGNADAELRPMLEVVYCDRLTVNAYVNPTTDGYTNDGSAMVRATGGVPPYTYLWSNAATTSEISDVASQLYNVIVSDSRM